MRPLNKSAKFIKFYTTDHNLALIIQFIQKNKSCNMYGDGLSEFLTKKVYELCKNKILPELNQIENSLTEKKEKSIILKEVPIEDSDFTNIELLEKFAKHNKTSVSEIIYTYIIFPVLEKDYLIKKTAS